MAARYALSPVPSASSPALNGASVFPPASGKRLQLAGKLEAMERGWAKDEYDAGRRLVQFWRRAFDDVVRVTLRPIAQAQYDVGSVVVSCLYRPDADACCFTSSDFVFLLEAVLGAHLGREARAYVRALLERYGPTPVSPRQPATAAFAKSLARLPEPAVLGAGDATKVYPWASLVPAIQLVYGKAAAL